jgi:predicted HAD superfamily phosphohydrolase YqeG
MDFFSDLDTSHLKNKQIFLDVDGTLTCDAQWELEGKVEKKARQLRKCNLIYLCTNGKDKARNASVARRLGVRYLDTPFQKPSRKMIPYLPAAKGRKRVVIGDKYLTDGRFAERIGAEFIKVDRLTSPSDRWNVRLIYLIDDFVWRWMR